MDRIVLDLLEQMGRSARVFDVCGGLLETVIAETGLPAGVVIVRVGERVEAGGAAVAENILRLFLDACRLDPDALDHVMTSDSPHVIADPAAGPFTGFGFEACVVVPLDLGDTDADGIVVLDADGLDERTARVAEAFRACGPGLGRCMQLERAEGRLRKIEEQRDLLTDIVNALPDPVVLSDAANDILLANDRAEHLFSSGGADSEGRRRAIQINNLLFSSFLTQAAIGGGEGEPGRDLTIVDPADGSDLVFEVLSEPLRRRGDSPADAAVLSILRDITDLKRAVTQLGVEINRSRAAEHRARQEWERLTAILQNVGDPILVTDDQSNIIQMNSEAERLFDVPAGFGPDTSRRNVVRTNDTRFSGLISDFLLQTAVRRVEQLEMIDPDSGETFPAEVVSSKLLNARGEPTVIVSIIHDLTQTVENERLATELQELNEELEDRIHHATEELEERNHRLRWQSRELEKASRLKSEFLANMSHELRTPINALLGYGAILREGIYGDLTDQQAAALSKISMAAQHLLALINDILDLSKIEAGKMLMTIEEVRVERLIDEVSETIEPLVREKSLEFEVDVGMPLPVVKTDTTKLRQVLLNLLSNAVKFTSEGGIALRAEARLAEAGGEGEAGGEEDDGGEGGVRIRVEDTGIGIAPDELETIFDDFRQVDQSSTREYGGTGLGLSITKKLLSLLGGTISVESEYGVGTCFIVDLPLELGRATPKEQVRRAVVDADQTVVKG